MEVSVEVLNEVSTEASRKRSAPTNDEKVSKKHAKEMTDFSKKMLALPQKQLVDSIVKFFSKPEHSELQINFATSLPAAETDEYIKKLTKLSDKIYSALPHS